MSGTAQRAQRSTLRVATRRSGLALAQTQLVVDRLRESANVECEILPITTQGDVLADRSLVAIGGDGVFVKELMNALLDGRADIAVHSAKDLPTSLPPELDAGVIPPRGDARDALVSKHNAYDDIAALPAGAIVGTSSLRRTAQLRLIRKDLRIEPLRGNVDTRVAKVHKGEYDAAILALAGLMRAGLLPLVAGARPLEPSAMVPAVGQGALFVQCRAADARVRELLAPLNHEPSALAVRLERTFLATVGGGCVAPIGANALVQGESWSLHALIAATDGTTFVRRSAQGRCTDAAEAVAAVETIASEMLAAGGRQIIASVK